MFFTGTSAPSPCNSISSQFAAAIMTSAPLYLAVSNGGQRLQTLEHTVTLHCHPGVQIFTTSDSYQPKPSQVPAVVMSYINVPKSASRYPVSPYPSSSTDTRDRPRNSGAPAGRGFLMSMSQRLRVRRSTRHQTVGLQSSSY
ncbi:hypothetical protein AB1N83_005138 [Pleurotus pulmonarius]